jgi:hypothetical protein
VAERNRFGIASLSDFVIGASHFAQARRRASGTCTLVPGFMMPEALTSFDPRPLAEQAGDGPSNRLTAKLIRHSLETGAKPLYSNFLA